MDHQRSKFNSSATIVGQYLAGQHPDLPSYVYGDQPGRQPRFNLAASAAVEGKSAAKTESSSGKDPASPPMPVDPLDKAGVFEKPHKGIGEILKQTKP